MSVALIFLYKMKIFYTCEQWYLLGLTNNLSHFHVNMQTVRVNEMELFLNYAIYIHLCVTRTYLTYTGNNVSSTAGTK